jgi:peptide chain release factor 3
MELARGGYPAFDLATFREGHITPVFFGSALKHFGVKELIEGLGQWAPGPRAQKAAERMVEPSRTEGRLALCFKVQANMDPNHRDRVAFMRVCSGQFRRGMKLKQSGTGKAIERAQPDPVLRPVADRQWTRPGLATSSASRTMVCCVSAIR